jgi:uncharacterized protein YndB with AHSA1/START domain
MRHDLKVSESIEIHASPEKVWHVLTKPELIKEYLFGTETITDWKVGSDIVFQGEYQGHKYKDKGVIKKNVTHKHISYSYWSGFSGLEDKPKNYCTVSYDLNSKDGKTTTFTWSQSGFANEEGQKHSQSGMAGLLKQIKDIAER